MREGKKRFDIENFQWEKFIDINKGRGIRMFIIFGLLTIALPLILFRVLDLAFAKLQGILGIVLSFSNILNYNMILLNGFILTLLIGMLGLMKDKTLMRFIMQAIITGMLFYFYYYGSALYSLFLPCDNFAQVYINIAESFVKVNFAPLAWIIFGINLIYCAKYFLEFYSNYID